MRLAYIMELKNVRRGRISEYADKFTSAKFVEGKRPWEVKVDIALPCATQNELNEEEAKRYINVSLKREYASENGTELNGLVCFNNKG